MKCKVCHKFIRKSNQQHKRTCAGDSKSYQHYLDSQSGKHNKDCSCVVCKKRREGKKKKIKP